MAPSSTATTPATCTSSSDPRPTASPCASASPSTAPPPGESHGADIDAAGEGIVIDQRLYQLVRQNGPVTDHTVEIRFLDPGVEAYAFTFG
jgi:hypothetical protein